MSSVARGSTGVRRWLCSRHLAALVLVAAVLLQACGGGAENTVAPADRPVDRERVLRWGIQGDPTSLDPHRAGVSQDGEALFLIYDRLVHQTPNGELVPGLAESWEFATDGMSLTLHLREGVTFHDGEPFNATAVKANVDRAKTLPGSAVALDLARVTEVTVLDEHTARLDLSTPYADLPAVLTDRAGAMVSPAALARGDVQDRPVGAGMYEFSEYRRGDSLELTRYAGYWEPGAQQLAGVRLSVLKDIQARFNAVRTGQIDLATLTPEETEQAKAAGLVVDDSPTLEVWYVTLNKTRNGLEKLNVRLALNYALDRRAIADALTDGHAEPAHQMIPPGYAGYSEEVDTDYYPYDPDRARQLLAEAEVPLPVEIELLSLGGRAQYEKAAQILQAQLAEVGFDVKIRTISPTEIADIFLVRLEGDSTVGPFGGRVSSVQAFQHHYGSAGFGNPGGFADPMIEQLLVEANATLDPDARAAVLERIGVQAAEQALTVPLFHPRTPVVSSPDVIGIEKYMSGKLELRGVGMARAA